MHSSFGYIHLLWLFAYTGLAAPSVVTTGGTVVVGSTASGVDTFQGIPFAQPPVGQLRLQPPQPLTTSLGTVNATTVPNQCPQFVGSGAVSPASIPLPAVLPLLAKLAVGGSPAPQSEDCLYLNVQRPANASSNDKLPVMVWIHGGGYETGSASTPPSNTGATIISRSVQLGNPVLFVAIQYRLNGFGFLAGSEVQAAGASNLGLRDQRLALQWVSRSIKFPMTRTLDQDLNMLTRFLT